MRRPMPEPYSLDLRKKAIAALEKKSVSEVSETFNVHRDTLRRWKQQLAQSGSCAPKQDYQQGHSHKITDWEAFCEFAEEHGDKTQAEMAWLWPSEISEATIGRALQTIGFTRKKRHMRTKKEMRSNGSST